MPHRDNRWRSAFLQDRRGSAAVAFAAAAFVAITATGAAVDYSMASGARAALDIIADEAAMAGVRAASGQDPKAVATSVFNGKAAALKSATVSSVTVTATQTSSTSTNRTVQVSYKGTVNTILMAVTGISTVNLAGTSTATNSQKQYIDFYFLIDTSGSMGYGATAADASNIYNLGTAKCMFACHYSYNDSYTQARKAGISMRIDVLRSAVQNAIKLIQDNTSIAGQFRVGLYPFINNMGTLFGLSTNLSAASTAAGQFTLDNGTSSLGSGGTFFGNVLPQFNKVVATSGDGTSAKTPKSVVIFVTDGMLDIETYTASTDTWWHGTPENDAVDPSLCQSLKNKGATVNVINFVFPTIVPPPNDAGRAADAKSTNAIIPKLAPALKSCASGSDSYFEGVYSTEIDAGIQNAIKASFLGSRFTQ